MIDDGIKVAVLLKRSPKELRDHIVLESPQLANVENKFPVRRELVQLWCRSLKSRQWKLPRLVLLLVILMQLCLRLVGKDRGKKRDTAKERIERKVRVKEKAKPKAKERKERRKGERKARARTTARKETAAGGLSNASNGGLNRFAVTVDTVGNGPTRKLNVISGKEDDRWNLEQWYHTRHSLLFLTLDPLYRNALSGEFFPLFNLPVGLLLRMLKKTGLKSGVMIGRATGQKTGMMTGLGRLQRNNRVSGTMMRVPIGCVESLARIQIRNSRTMRK